MSESVKNGPQSAASRFLNQAECKDCPEPERPKRDGFVGNVADKAGASFMSTEQLQGMLAKLRSVVLNPEQADELTEMVKNRKRN